MNTTNYPLKKQLKHEIKLFQKQKAALSKPQAAHLPDREKETLFNYFKDSIEVRRKKLTQLNQLTREIAAQAATTRAADIEVLEPEIV